MPCFVSALPSFAKLPLVPIGIIVLLVGSSIAYIVIHFFKRGGFKSKTRDLDMAIVGLTQQIRRNPKDALAHTKRGVARYRKGDKKGALEDLGKAIEIDEFLVEAHYNLGLICAETGVRKRAIEEFEWIRQHSEDPFYKTAVREKLKKLRGES